MHIYLPQEIKLIKEEVKETRAKKTPAKDTPAKKKEKATKIKDQNPKLNLKASFQVGQTNVKPKTKAKGAS
jgi:hypothetical protein